MLHESEVCLRAGWCVHAGPPLQMRGCPLPHPLTTPQCSIATRVATCHHSYHYHYDSRVRTTTAIVMTTMTTSIPGASYPIAYLPIPLLPHVPCLKTALPALLCQSPHQDGRQEGLGLYTPALHCLSTKILQQIVQTNFGPGLGPRLASSRPQPGGVGVVHPGLSLPGSVHRRQTNKHHDLA